MNLKPLAPLTSNSKLLSTFIIIPIIFGNAAFAERLAPDPNAILQVGINVGQANDGYYTDDAPSILPHAFYDNHRWYIEGAEAGLYGYKDTKNHWRIGISYDGRSFDAETATTPAFKELNNRDWSVLAHTSYMRITPIGGFRLKVAMDALARHESAIASLAHLSKFEFLDDQLTLYPSIGVAWYSKQYNRYYYGIDDHEAKKTGIDAYSPAQSFNPYVSIAGEYQLTDSWSIFGNGRIEKLSKTQTDSPLIKDGTTTTTRIGVNYAF